MICVPIPVTAWPDQSQRIVAVEPERRDVEHDPPEPARRSLTGRAGQTGAVTIGGRWRRAGRYRSRSAEPASAAWAAARRATGTRNGEQDT